MTKFHSADRILLSDVINRLQCLPDSPARKSTQQLGLVFTNQYYTSKNTLNQSFNTSSLPKIASQNLIIKPPCFKKISSELHDQGDSYFCWAYSIATILKNEISRIDAVF